MSEDSNHPTARETVIAAARSQMGSPYVYGMWGRLCTPGNRRQYAGYNPAYKRAIYRVCAVLSGKQRKCEGCKWQGRRAFDCRGFTHWCLDQAGIDIKGGGATSQYNNSANWQRRGEIEDLPDTPCCVFIRKGRRMSHTGLYIGGGRVIHCSGTVKESPLAEGGWTHFAVPHGMEDGDTVLS